MKKTNVLLHLLILSLLLPSCSNYFVVAGPSYDAGTLGQTGRDRTDSGRGVNLEIGKIIEDEFFLSVNTGILGYPGDNNNDVFFPISLNYAKSTHPIDKEFRLTLLYGFGGGIMGGGSTNPMLTARGGMNLEFPSTWGLKVSIVNQSHLVIGSNGRGGVNNSFSLLAGIRF